MLRARAAAGTRFDVLEPGIRRRVRALGWHPNGPPSHANNCVIVIGARIAAGWIVWPAKEAPVMPVPWGVFSVPRSKWGMNPICALSSPWPLAGAISAVISATPVAGVGMRRRVPFQKEWSGRPCWGALVGLGNPVRCAA